jgi:Mn-dependent DtxR family transcriptional regulator
MAYKHTTRDAVLRYLQMSGGRRSVWAIVRYMREIHGVDGGATRMMLQRLHSKGLIEHPKRGYYQWGLTGLDVEAPAETKPG